MARRRKRVAREVRVEMLWAEGRRAFFRDGVEVDLPSADRLSRVAGVTIDNDMRAELRDWCAGAVKDYRAAVAFSPEGDIRACVRVLRELSELAETLDAAGLPPLRPGDVRRIAAPALERLQLLMLLAPPPNVRTTILCAPPGYASVQRKRRGRPRHDWARRFAKGVADVWRAAGGQSTGAYYDRHRRRWQGGAFLLAAELLQCLGLPVPAAALAEVMGTASEN